MSQPCPSCGKPLDATRAPVARVRGAKVVTYCSVSCADAGSLRVVGSDTGMPAVAPAAAPAPAKAAEKTATVKPAQVTAPVRAPEPARGPGPASTAEPGEVARRGAAEPAATVVPLRAETSAAPRRRGGLLLLSALVLAAGVGVVAYQVWPPGGAESKGDGAARRIAPPAAPAEPAAAPGPPALDPQEVYRASLAELHRLSQSTSPRVQRLAAQVLARTGDAEALAQLRRLLADETGQSARIEMLYALARAEDAAARASLKALLQVTDRDSRLKAAESLVYLGDDSGRRALRAFLEYDDYRIGAAAALARLHDEEGLRVLRAELKRKTTPDKHMRAVVALGRAGAAEVREELRAIVADARFNVPAADALAVLRDPAAVQPLVGQLGTSSMRLKAAVWLRRLDQKVDLAPLALLLKEGDEASRVSAAEALLILTGPKNLAERD